jgi:hypothetical protein
VRRERHGSVEARPAEKPGTSGPVTSGGLAATLRGLGQVTVFDDRAELADP